MLDLYLYWFMCFVDNFETMVTWVVRIILDYFYLASSVFGSICCIFVCTAGENFVSFLFV